MIIVDRIPALFADKKAKETAALLRSAAERLSDLGAWPDRPDVKVQVVGDGDRPPASVRFVWDAIRAMGTENDVVDGSQDDVVARREGTVCTILASKAFLGCPLAAELVGKGVRPDDIALFFLGHESHHVTEPERQASCGVTSGASGLRVFRGATPLAPKEWIAAAHYLADVERDAVGPTKTFREAIDAFDEGAADALGLWLLRLARPEAWEDVCRVTSSIRAKCPEHGYDVSWLLDELLAEGLPASLPALYAACCSKAFARAVASTEIVSRPNLAELLRARIQEPWQEATVGQRPAGGPNL